MNELIIFAAALLPAVVLWLYVWRQDCQPEPPSWLFRAVLYGVLISIPVSMMEMFVETLFFGSEGEAATLLGVTLDAFFVAALPEEGFKLLALWFVLRNNPYFDEHYDGIVYAACVGLGFASVENVLYLFGNIESWQSVAVSRALLAVPGHYAFAILMGYYYSIHHFVDHSLRTTVCVILVPVVAHGIYDTLAFSGQISPYLGGLGFFVLVYFCVKMHKFARVKMLTMVEKDKRMNMEA